jgi:hypothetical protein
MFSNRLNIVWFGNMVYRCKFHVLLTMIMERLILFLFDTALVALAIWFVVEIIVSIC